MVTVLTLKARERDEQSRSPVELTLTAPVFLRLGNWMLCVLAYKDAMVESTYASILPSMYIGPLAVSKAGNERLRGGPS